MIPKRDHDYDFRMTWRTGFGRLIWRETDMTNLTGDNGCLEPAYSFFWVFGLLILFLPKISISDLTLGTRISTKETKHEYGEVVKLVVEVCIFVCVTFSVLWSRVSSSVFYCQMDSDDDEISTEVPIPHSR